MMSEGNAFGRFLDATKAPQDGSVLRYTRRA